MTENYRYPLLSLSPYLPPLASVISLFPKGDVYAFIRAHLVLVFAFAWFFAALLCRLATGRVTPVGWLAALAVVHMTPGSWVMLRVNNIEPLLWCLFAAVFLSMRWAPVWLLLIASVKVHAVWPLLALAVRDPRHVLRTVAPVALLLTGITLVAMGPSALLSAAGDWLRYVPGMLGQGTFNSSNVSLSFLPLRAARLLGWDYQPGPLPLVVRIWLLAVSVIAPVMAIWLTRRMRQQLQVAIVTAVALLASPLCWSGYLVAFLAPAAWAYREGLWRLPFPDAAEVSIERA